MPPRRPPRPPRPRAAPASAPVRPRRRPIRAAVRAIRRRRAPEDARRELLDAAEALFATHHPGSLGLAKVARAAGVSHALVTHYFGTYAGLVDAVLERRSAALRDHVVERLRTTGLTGDPRALFAALFEALGDPVQVRLWRWTLATERPAAADFFPLRNQGLRVVATEVTAAIAAARGIPAAQLAPAVETTLLVAVAAAFGYCLGKPLLLGALGRPGSAALDARVHQTLGDLVVDHLRGLADAHARAT